MGVAFVAQPTQTYTVPSLDTIEKVESLGSIGVNQYTVTGTFSNPASTEATITVDLQ